MSDKIGLTLCVCGRNAGIYNMKAILPKVFKDVEGAFSVHCDGKMAEHICEATTPTYATIAEAVEAWNAMHSVLQNGWSSEVPTEEGHYLLIGSYEDRFDNPVILAKPMYARLSMAYTDATGKKPDGVVATVDGFTGWPHQFNGLWYRIHYPPLNTKETTKDTP